MSLFTRLTNVELSLIHVRQLSDVPVSALLWGGFCLRHAPFLLTSYLSVSSKAVRVRYAVCVSPSRNLTDILSLLVKAHQSIQSKTWKIVRFRKVVNTDNDWVLDGFDDNALKDLLWNFRMGWKGIEVYMVWIRLLRSLRIFRIDVNLGHGANSPSSFTEASRSFLSS